MMQSVEIQQVSGKKIMRTLVPVNEPNHFRSLFVVPGTLFIIQHSDSFMSGGIKGIYPGKK